MKRAVIVLLTLCVLCATLVLPASAEMAADQSLADVIASGAEHLKLTHANHKEYSLEASPYPENLKNDEYKIGSTVFDHADVCFLNVKEGGDSFESQTPGTVTWEIEEGKYNVFQCLWGKGAWEHSAGAKEHHRRRIKRSGADHRYLPLRGQGRRARPRGGTASRSYRGRQGGMLQRGRQHRLLLLHHGAGRGLCRR